MINSGWKYERNLSVNRPEACRIVCRWPAMQARSVFV